MAEVLVAAVVIVAIVAVLWLALRPRAAPAPPKSHPSPNRGSDPGSGTRDPRRPRPQLGSGAIGLPPPLAKRKPTRAVGRRLRDR
jgi:hypothetical protein